jgi:peptidylprolyl isomerase
MKHTLLILLIAASTAAASAQGPVKPAAPAATAKPASTAARSTASAANKLPPGVKPEKGIVKTAFSLRYQDVKIGTGADAEPNKLYHVNYTGWLDMHGAANDGYKFDSSYDHPGQPLKDKDGKPVLGPDGKPATGDPQPFVFPQGFGRLIPGWDQGFSGMKIGGKRRLFIPYQLAYGAKGRPGPDAKNPGIPPKADLIFDVELVDVTDMPAQPTRPGMGPGGRPAPGAPPRPGMGAPPNAPPGQPGNGAATPPPTPGAPAAPAAPAKPAAPPAPAAPGAPPAPAATPAPAAPSTPPPSAPATPPPSY